MHEKFMVEFVKEYGIKEGIILSRLCEEQLKKTADEFIFTYEDVEKIFKYLSGKQVRIGINNLLDRGAIKLYEPDEKEFSRTLYYTVNDKKVVQYLKLQNTERKK
jgi:hypothetical protein